MKSKIENPWADVDRARKQLHDAELNPNPTDIDINFLNKLEECWRALDRVPGTSRDRTFVPYDFGVNPLEVVMWYVELGQYPPPEFMLALRDSWDRYIDASGELSLEEAFLGKIKRKSGSFANRKKSHFKVLRAWFEISVLKDKSRCSLQKAVERWVDQHPEAGWSVETAIRQIRPFAKRDKLIGLLKPINSD